MGSSCGEAECFFATWFLIPSSLAVHVRRHVQHLCLALTSFNPSCLPAMGAGTGTFNRGPAELHCSRFMPLVTVNSVVWYPGFNVGPAKEMLLQMLSALTAALVQCYLVIKGPALLGDAAA